MQVHLLTAHVAKRLTQVQLDELAKRVTDRAKVVTCVEEGDSIGASFFSLKNLEGKAFADLEHVKATVEKLRLEDDPSAGKDLKFAFEELTDPINLHNLEQVSIWLKVDLSVDDEEEEDNSLYVRGHKKIADLDQAVVCSHGLFFRKNDTIYKASWPDVICESFTESSFLPILTIEEGDDCWVDRRTGKVLCIKGDELLCEGKPLFPQAHEAGGIMLNSFSIFEYFTILMYSNMTLLFKTPSSKPLRLPEIDELHTDPVLQVTQMAKIKHDLHLIEALDEFSSFHYYLLSGRLISRHKNSFKTMKQLDQEEDHLQRAVHPSRGTVAIYLFNEE